MQKRQKKLLMSEWYYCYNGKNIIIFLKNGKEKANEATFSFQNQRNWAGLGKLGRICTVLRNKSISKTIIVQRG
jgi:hypothetical protein